MARLRDELEQILREIKLQLEKVDVLKELADSFEYMCKTYYGRPFVSKSFNTIMFRCSEMKLVSKNISLHIYGGNISLTITPREPRYLEPVFRIDVYGLNTSDIDVSILRVNGFIKYNLALPVKTSTIMYSIPVKVFGVKLSLTYGGAVKGYSVGLTVYEEK